MRQWIVGTMCHARRDRLALGYDDVISCVHMYLLFYYFDQISLKPKLFR